MTTKVCPQCDVTLGRTARTCECGHQFAKGHGNGAKEVSVDEVSTVGGPPLNHDWKGKVTKPPKKSRKKPGKNPAEIPPTKANSADDHFRVGIFNDGGLAILAKLGALELSAEEAGELAGFCAQHFGDE